MPSTVVLASRYGLPLNASPEFVRGYLDVMRWDEQPRDALGRFARTRGESGRFARIAAKAEQSGVAKGKSTRSEDRLSVTKELIQGSKDPQGAYEALTEVPNRYLRQWRDEALGDVEALEEDPDMIDDETGTIEEAMESAHYYEDLLEARSWLKRNGGTISDDEKDDLLSWMYENKLDSPFAAGYRSIMRMDSVRPSCMECVEKHLGAALVLMGEAEAGYPEHKLLAIGHLHEAAEESADMRPELSALLRDIRKRYQQGEAVEFESILEALNQHGVWRFDQDTPTQGQKCGGSHISQAYVCRVNNPGDNLAKVDVKKVLADPSYDRYEQDTERWEASKEGPEPDEADYPYTPTDDTKAFLSDLMQLDEPEEVLELATEASPASVKKDLTKTQNALRLAEQYAAFGDDPYAAKEVLRSAIESGDLSQVESFPKAKELAQQLKDIDPGDFDEVMELFEYSAKDLAGYDDARDDLKQIAANPDARKAFNKYTKWDPEAELDSASDGYSREELERREQTLLAASHPDLRKKLKTMQTIGTEESNGERPYNWIMDQLWKAQEAKSNRTDSFLQGYLEVMSWRFDRKGEGVACGRGWISRRKKCGRDKARTTTPEAKARTVEKQKVRQQLRGQVKAAKGQKPYVKPKPEPDTPQKYPTRLPKDHVVTTNKRITAARIDKALNAIDSPGAKERVGMFRAFVAKTGVQSVFADPSASLTDHLDVVERGLKDKRYASQDGGLLRNTKADPTAAGYTTFLWNHVVITSDSRGRDGPFAASSEKLKQSADRIFEANAEDELIRDVTTFPSSVSGSVRDRDSRELMTYIHEVGHQVHAKAGVPPVPMTIKGSATNYGAVNEEEWFAEHFALWMLDAPRYEQLDPAGAQFIRDSLTKATESPVSVEELMARGKA